MRYFIKINFTSFNFVINVDIRHFKITYVAPITFLLDSAVLDHMVLWLRTKAVPALDQYLCGFSSPTSPYSDHSLMCGSKSHYPIPLCPSFL